MAHGHTVYLDSNWALTSISQRQFWRGYDLSQYGDGRVGGILSVDISNWTAPGNFNGKPAMAGRDARGDQGRGVGAAEGGAERTGRPTLEDAIVDWFLDPDIEFPTPAATNAEPLLINHAGSLALRPEAHTEIGNLLLAATRAHLHRPRHDGSGQ